MRMVLFLIAMAGCVIISCEKSGAGISGSDTQLPAEQDIQGDGVLPDSDSIQIVTANPFGFEGEQAWGVILPTGQKECYDNLKPIACPNPGEPFYGQDPQFGQYKTRSFNPLGKAVKDEDTGVFWQAGYTSGLTWPEANNYCENLSLEGFEGKHWRLSTPHELRSLINYGKKSGGMPAHPATDFPAATPNDWFWASARVQDKLTAWVVYLYDGFLEYTSVANKYSVRCVARD